MTQVDDHSPPGTAQDAGFRLRVSSPTSTREHVLDRPRSLVGRGDDCDIVIDDATVSRHHVVLELDGGGVQFHDLGGTNMPILDGRSMREGVLAPGSVLLIGLTRLTLEVVRAADETREVATARPTRVLRLAPASADLAPHAGRPLLTPFQRPVLRGPDFVAEVAPHLLDAALAVTGRTRGALAMVESPARLRVLAAVPADPTAFPLPADVLRDGIEPICIDPWPAGVAELDRVVVPIETEAGRAMLILGVPGIDAPEGREALERGVAFGRIAARELTEAALRERDGRELRRLRFSQSYASRTLLARTRLHGLRRRVAEAAIDGAPVLLLGHEGCEFEEVAAFYHAQADTGAGPFVACYPRLLPQHRLAQELGDALAIHEGKGSCAVRARGGTLFVDSPEALPAALQRRLAEILTANLDAPAEQRFRVVLSLVLQEADARPPLETELDAVVRGWTTGTIPPLQGLPEDVSALTEIVLDEMGPTSAGAPRRVSEDAERLLRAYHWPGNARQHRRVVESAASRAGASVVQPRHLPEEVREPITGELRVLSLRDAERAHIYRVLSLCGDNRERAARKLGISPSTLHGKLVRYEQDG